ncbi:hypothetical protein PCANC_25435 [Puccinia coronata f. sp. avenae]|uniref:CCHC-type domain-containing protein n=1 Tax=Puccinia coronata f. sp. avenae TaxID=200324 RepID=A0A2N5TMX2_9BASI|nr:hypothetical protein PCANC_25435 [Puccinia coronata f. sp. avenae]
MMKLGQCFRCKAHGHLARDCPEKGKGKESVQINELEEELRRLKLDGATNRASATPPRPIPNPLFLIDSGATHDVISKKFARSTGLIDYARPARRTVSGFDGSRSDSSFEVDITINSKPHSSTFIITGLKDSYQGILGILWIQRHGHTIDWQTRTFRRGGRRAATAVAVLSSPPPSPPGPMGNARMTDKGVCAMHAITPPQCEPISPLPYPPHETASKQTPPLEPDNYMRRTMDRHADICGAPTVAGPSVPDNPSQRSMEPGRPARLTDGEVCANGTLTLPRCESNDPPTQKPLLAAGELPFLAEQIPSTPDGPETPAIASAKASSRHFRHNPPMEAPKPGGQLGYVTRECVLEAQFRPTVGICAAKTSWSTSVRLAADSKLQEPSRTVEELVPKEYHQFLGMFQKKNSQTQPPRRQYNFRVEQIKGAVPQASRIIPLFPAEKYTALKTLITDRLTNGTIRRTTSPWAAPVLFTGKKDRNLRPCFDYRKLNAVTVENCYPLPLTMDLIDSLLDADQFTKLDLRNAYGNLRVAEGNKEKLAFICSAGQFATLTMPFGPTGAPGYFQYFMQDILVGCIGKDVAAYLDDIMIYTQKGSDHAAAVTLVLETLSKHQLWLKPEKLRMDPGKVKAVTDWPTPRNVTELQRFIGFANFYRRFIDHFSGTARPLHDLTKAKTPFIWDTRCTTAFEQLKTAFTTTPILTIANPYWPFILECNCSDYALGAVLLQVCNTDKELHPVAFLSRSLVTAEKNYKIFDKELLANVAAFKEWRHYLEGNPHRLKAIV